MVAAYGAVVRVAARVQPEDQTVLHTAVLDRHVVGAPLEADAVAAVVAHGAIADGHVVGGIEVNPRPRAAMSGEGLGPGAVPVEHEPLDGRMADIVAAHNLEGPDHNGIAGNGARLSQRPGQAESLLADLLG